VAGVLSWLRSGLRSMNRHQAAWAFLAIAAVFFALHQIKAVTVYPADSGGYWGLAGRVAILNFPQTWRGYFYPLLLSPARVASYLMNSVLPYRVFASLAYSFLLTVVIPDFYVRVFGGRLSFLRRLVAPLLLTVLAPGVMVYPLSDLPAILMLICSLYAILLSGETPGLRRSCVLMVAAGVMLGGAYNTRTIYLFSLVLVVCATTLWWTRARALRHRAILIVALLSGVVLVSLPQAFINLKTHGSFTPAVVTTQFGPQSLFGTQLTLGLKVQRYETALDPVRSVPYVDPAGQRLLSVTGFDKKVFGLGEYAAFVLRHPVDFVGILARHVINGLDLRDGEVYLVDPNRSRWLQSTINYAVLFVAALILLIRPRTRPASPSVLANDASGTTPPIRFERTDWVVWLSALLLPVVAIAPGMIETRFFLPLHLLAYYTVAISSSWAELKGSLGARWPVILMLFVGLYVVLAIVTGDTLSHRALAVP
jgi:hypothetical protein